MKGAPGLELRQIEAAFNQAGDSPSIKVYARSWFQEVGQLFADPVGGREFIDFPEFRNYRWHFENRPKRTSDVWVDIPYQTNRHADFLGQADRGIDRSHSVCKTAFNGLDFDAPMLSLCKKRP